MATLKEVVVPDLGNTPNAEVIDIIVKPGDTIKLEDALLTLESDKASMDIPASSSGIVEEIKLKVGDKVAAGTLILTLREAEDSNSKGTKDTQDTQEIKDHPGAKNAEDVAPNESLAEPSHNTVLQDIVLPDLGTTGSVDVIEVSIKPGDSISKDMPLVTLEGDKATMEIPSSYTGTIKQVSVKVGDKVNTGSVIATIESISSSASPALTASTEAVSSATVTTSKVTTAEVTNPAQAAFKSADQPASVAITPSSATPGKLTHAGPAVRRFARELGVELGVMQGSGHKERILKEDVQAFVKQELARAKALPTNASSDGKSAFPMAPVVDFTAFGEIETRPLTRIKKLTGSNLHRNWVLIPHITQFDEADITELEVFRKAQQTLPELQNIKLTPLVFLMKAIIASLKKYPQFNASLDATGEHLLLKKYFHIGVAVDTPEGLVVPVIRDVDQKGLLQLAEELAEISVKARKKGLTAADMQGGCFTISSLGGIGGTAFTPIVNLPEVAILGVSKAAMKPVYQNGQFVPRCLLPLSLSYDHRVIDGAEGARFITYLSSRLSDIRQLLL